MIRSQPKPAPNTGLDWSEATRSIRDAETKARSELRPPVAEIERWLDQHDAAGELACGHLPLEACSCAKAAA
jgi:hypothetical protein